MRAAKSSLVKALKEETKVNSVPHLPQEEHKTAVVVDDMYNIRHWSFQRDETFGDIARRYLCNLLKDVPDGTKIVHFCCDRYSPIGLKSSEQQRRYARSKPARLFEVSEQ